MPGGALNRPITICHGARRASRSSTMNWNADNPLKKGPLPAAEGETLDDVAH